jgi:hypothetical protein
MPRRRKDSDFIEPIAQLIGALVLLSFVSPQVRQDLAGLGAVGVCFVAVAAAGLIGFGVYRFTRRRQRQYTFYADVTSPLVTRGVASSEIKWKPIPAIEETRPQLTTTDDFVERLRSIDWFQFEQIVGLTYQKLGYAVTRRGGANPDGGIDLIIEKDGRNSGVQCKHWKAWNVGVKPVREFLGALTDSGIRHGVFVMLGGCTGDAKQLADKHGIEIVNEADLAAMLDQTDARFDPEALEILNDTRKYCPKCGSELVIRTARKGIGAGRQFWGCSTYPRCRYILREGRWRS